MALGRVGERTRLACCVRRPRRTHSRACYDALTHRDFPRPFPVGGALTGAAEAAALPRRTLVGSAGRDWLLNYFERFLDRNRGPKLLL